MSNFYRIYLNLFLFIFLFEFLGNLVVAQSSCVTPDNLSGNCLHYRECPDYLKELKRRMPNVRTRGPFLLRSRCSADTEFLCCDKNFLQATQQPTVVSTNLALESSDSSDSSNFVPNLNARGLGVLQRLHCGESSIQKLAFGNVADLSAYPWMALLEYNARGSPFLCGGSLISNRYVLTAAHCIKQPYTLVGVRLGEHDLTTEIDCTTGGRRKKPKCAPPHENFGIEKTIIHPSYRQGSVSNDIALIKLNRNVVFKDHISPICLPISRSADISPENFLIAGWGNTETKLNVSSDVLMYGSITNYALKVCTDFYSNYPIDESMLCTGGLGPVDSCKGDSGGPAFTVGIYLPENVRFIQYGVVSFGDRRCDSLDKTPGIYTNIRHFMPWITSNIDS